jgi:metal-responsive CopG/Arc/MetJ family transcriptional regulator
MEPKISVSLKIGKSLLAEVDAFAKANGLKRSEAVRLLIRASFVRLQKGEPVTVVQELDHCARYLAPTEAAESPKKGASVTP